ncbi:GTPase domain-containing protein [Fimbriiglobus ruber]|uniref:Putative ATP-binding protein n=1 Tax=Fimbriiglobus ruber TaxID=1908690 RepID=A0A225DC38_9BACT|nr:GTPase domain-containing protein [Fimbriiglobus ruber]OWK34709.1 putative ATP-binding protein [Fimbriiglobus ruber]
MDAHDHRAAVRQLADDLGWLEDHCRRQSDLAAHAAHLRMAAALTRNVVGPAIDGQPPRPLFIAVVGGAGAGKSTVSNLLAGSVVADANPQAGYTRHPTAYLPAALGVQWPSYLGFLGPLTRLSQTQPANLDEDVYQVKRVPAPDNGAADPLSDFVIWDCPDMTTWASTGYVSRLMEVVGLADVVVYVASDERYNDEVPTQFLHHVIRAGKAVVVCLTKVREADAAALTEHFRTEVLGRLPPVPGGGPQKIPCVTIPQLPADVRADPAGKAAPYRIQLLNQILVLCPDAASTRARTVRNAIKYLESAGAGLLEVARKDLAEVDAWRGAVAAGLTEFETRYRTEFLAGESFRRFDRTREQVLEMLELTGPGKYLSAGLSLLRVPYRYARDFFAKLVVRPAMPSQPEQVVCAAALAAWLDGLQAEALRRSSSHPVWKQITRGFDGGLKTEVQDRFLQIFRSFELKESDELDRAARAVPELLAKSPVLLAVIRLGVVALDLTAAGAVVWATWPPNWYLLLLVPLAVSLTRQCVELGVWQVVDAGRNRLRDHREALLAEHLAGPLAAWLNDWPTSGGSSVERLQLVLTRIPATIRDLATMAAQQAPAPTTPSSLSPSPQTPVPEVAAS